jgi:two-component system, OmpR family, sensor kinase
MSLRARLVIVVAALLAVGLIIAAAATLAALRYFLFARTDAQLDQLSSAVPAQVANVPPRRRDLADSYRQMVASGEPLVIMQVRKPNGKLVRDLSSPTLSSVTLHVRPDAPTAGNPNGAVYRTVSVAGEKWRVRAAWLPNKQGMLLLGLPLSDLHSTFQGLYLAEAVVTGAVLVAITLVALRVIRYGLRPLDHIAEVASAIGAGDLDRRINLSPPNTEIGRLTGALNAMLVQIQTAFHERLGSEERLRRFVADASHELNTPIATIRGYAELFRHGAASNPDELALAMRRIESEATRMGQLVTELLLLAKLDEGRPLESRPVDLAHLAAEAVADARAIEPDRPVRARVDGEVTVTGDEPRLRQLLTNLLANVRRHTPAGTPSEVRVAVDGEYAVIEVADEGPGIPAEHANRVFERFYRPAAARSRGGSGLGLAIVASIAAAHGGDARVRSVEGAGTTFVIRLRRNGPPPTETAADEPGGAEQQDEPSVSR